MILRIVRLHPDTGEPPELLGVLGVLGIIVVATVVFAAIYARDPKRREDAQAVLRTLFGRS